MKSWCGTIIKDDIAPTCRIGEKGLQFIDDMRSHANRLIDSPSWREPQVCLERKTFGEYITIMRSDATRRLDPLSMERTVELLSADTGLRRFVMEVILFISRS